MSNFIKFVIGLEGDAAFNSKLKAAEQRANEFVSALKAGVGIDLGGKLVNSIAAIPSILQQATARGVAYNRSIADSEIAIANVVKRFRNLDDAAARGEAAKAIAKIKQVEPEAAGTLQTLIQGFMATYASSAAAGVSIEQNVELVGMFANALANANIPAEQLSQELSAIFTGNITPDAALGKLLQITSADLTSAKEAGKLYEFLVEKVGSLGKAGDTSAVALSSLDSAFDAALGELTRPVQLALDEAVKALTEDLKNMPREELQALGNDIAELVRSGSELTRWIVQNTNAWLPWVATFGKAATVLAAFKLADLLLGLTSLALRLTATAQATTAETAAVIANTRAWQGNTAARAGAGAAGAAGRGGALAAGAGLLSRASWIAVGALIADGLLDTLRNTNFGTKLANLAQGGGFQLPPDFTPEQAAAIRDRNNAAAASRAAAGADALVAPPRTPEQIEALKREAAPAFADGTLTDAERRDLATGGLTGDEQWAAKMARAEELRGFLGTTLGLGDGFTAAAAGDAAEAQGGTREQLESVLAAITEMRDLEKEIGEMQEENAEHSRESAEDAAKRAAERERELATMAAQLEIAEAELAGDERRKILLEAELAARQTMERLTDRGVPEAQALALAERSATVQRDLALKALEKKGGQIDAMKPSFGKELEAVGGRGARQRREAREDFAAKLREAGASAEQIEGKLAEYDQARLDAQGRIGGRVARSTRDTLGPGLLDAAAPSADFEKAFGRRAVPNFGDAVPTSPAAAPGGAALENAANSTEQLAGQLDSAAGAIQGLNGSVAGAAGAMQAAGSAIAALDAAVSQLQSIVSGLKNGSGR